MRLREDDVVTQRTGDVANATLRRRSDVWLRWIFPEVDSPFAQVLRAGRTTLGRDPSCDLVLSSNIVSRRHAEILREGPVISIRNLSTTNRVRVDGVAVSHAVVSPGQVVRVGDHLAILTAGADGGVVDEVGPSLWIGPSARDAWALAAQAAPTNLPVYISGPTGTGKDRIAQAIHRQSGRPGAFIPVNCAALSEALVESELFGHQKGAFTGAHAVSIGKFQAANEGTLFLDELAELPKHVQAKLLRVLEDGTVWPVGASRGIGLNVRILAAAQQPIDELVESGQLRSDLRERLGAVEVTLLPLKERREEILPLAYRLLAKHGGGKAFQFDVQVAERLCVHTWPGNVRELDHLVRRLVAFGAATLQLSDLPPRLQQDLEPKERETPSPRANPEVDRKRLGRLLAKNGGKVNDAAAELGFSRQRAYRLLRGRPPAELISSLESEEVG